MVISKKGRKEMVPEVVEAKTASLSNVAEPEAGAMDELKNTELKGTERMTEAMVKSAPSREKPVISGFQNAPKVVPALIPKGDRSYGGVATCLMNELYDAAEVPAMEILPGWDRISLVVARACERLEKSGWRRGKR